jgi:hypothetical protein
VNEQVKAGLNAVKDFLSGRSGEAKLDDADDQATRQVVGAELLSAMSARNADEPAQVNPANASATDTQETPRFNAEDAIPETAEVVINPKDTVATETAEEVSPESTEDVDTPRDAVASDAAESGEPDQPDQSDNSKQDEQERARRLFLDHGYFDEAVEKLGSATSPAERVAAARALGLFGSPRGTPHLIAAMFDDDADVRSAAEESLALIGDPTIGKVSAEVEVNESHEASTPTLPPPAMEVFESTLSETSSETTSETTSEVTPETSSEIASDAVATEAARVGDIAGVADAAAVDLAGEESEMLREEQAIKGRVEQLSKQLFETMAAIKESENEVQWRIEREGQLRADAAERRRAAEEARRLAAEEAETRRIQEREAIAAEQAARTQAELEAERQAGEEASLRLEAARLRIAADELARRRAEMETARIEAQAAAREAEVARVRDEANALHEAALARLRSEEDGLRTATNEVELQQASVNTSRQKAEEEINRLKEEQRAAEEAQQAEAERLRLEAQTRNKQAEARLQEELAELRRAGEEVASRRAEAEAAREKADTEAERLLEAQARMRVAEDARAQAETERARLEVELNQQLETQLGVLEETRRRGDQELAHVQEEIQRHAQAKEQRLSELEERKARAEAESKLQTEREQQILSQIDSLRIADTETRRRIADAEVRRKATEDAYRVVAEKVQRVEAEAHARAKEEERIIAKLEAERRTVANEAQARAEQEKRIKEEIEMFRRLEEQERPRIEEATLELADAEARLHERKEQLLEEEEARGAFEDRLDRVGESQPSISPVATLAVVSETQSESATLVGREVVRHEVVRQLPETDQPAAAATVAEDLNAESEAFDAEDVLVSPVAPAVATYLNSTDPYKRAAAVSELARSGGTDAFDQIVQCFDDHSPHVRNAAARAFRKLEPKHTVDLFNRALEGASTTRRQNIGAAIAASGLAAEAVENLASENREDTYNALSILFVMAKTGEVYPLVQAIEGHESVQVRMAAIKLLTLTGQAELANTAAKRRLNQNPLSEPPA